MMRASLLVSPIVAAIVLAGCTGDTRLPFENGAFASPNVISLDRTVLRTAVGDTARLHLIRSRHGASTGGVRWRVDDPSIAGVEDGLVFPLAPGSTQVSASVAGGTATASVVTWGAIEVSGLSISPDPVDLEPGQNVQLDAELHYSNGLIVKLRTSPSWKSLNVTVATVKNGRLVGVANGTAKIAAQMGSVADTIEVMVGSGHPDKTPSPAPSKSFVNPELPREYLNTEMPTVTGRTIHVPAGSSLQNAVDTAQAGDELVLEAGATYTGTLVLPKKTGPGWIVIRSSGSLPAPGVRVTPADAPRLARLVAAKGTDRVVRTEPGAQGYRLIGLEITADHGTTKAYTLVEFGIGGSSQNTLASQPHNLILDRVYIHGTPTLDFQRCVALNSAYTAIIDSWLSECHGKGFDSQAIGGWNGTGPYKIVNNHLAGAGENVMFGGADPRIPGALPRDIEIRRNHFIKPAEWDGPWTAKNLLEFKIGQRILVEGNVFENSWRDGQIGFALNIKTVNQNGGAPWSETSDITFRYNIVRNSAHGVSIGANPGEYDGVAASRMRFEHNIFDRIGTGDYPGGRLFQAGRIDNLMIAHNTAISSHSFLILTAGPAANLTVTDNIFAGTSYGLTANGSGYGTTALNARSDNWIFTGNIVSGMTASRYPAGNSFSSSIEDVGFKNYSRGELGISDYHASSPGADVNEVLVRTAGVVR